MDQLSLEERTIGAILRLPVTTCTPTYGTHISDELKPFLDKPEDFEVLSRASSSDMDNDPKGEFGEVLGRNPFVNFRFHPIIKDIIIRSEPFDYSMADTLLWMMDDPVDRSFVSGSFGYTFTTIPAASLASLLVGYGVFADRLGIFEPVHKKIHDYIAKYKEAIQKEYEAAKTAHEEFKAAHPSIFDQSRTKLSEFSQEERGWILISTELSGKYGEFASDLASFYELDNCLDPEFYKDPANPKFYQGEGKIYIEEGLYKQDEVFLNIVLAVTKERMRSYVEKYGINTAGH